LKLGAGRPFKLKVKERLLMLLVYYGLYITFTLAGFLFDTDQSNVYRNLSTLGPLIKQCIPLPKKVYKRTRRLRNIDEVEEYFLVSRHLWILPNRRFHDQRIRERERIITQVKRKSICKNPVYGK
jgi:hypothetical protein